MPAGVGDTNGFDNGRSTLGSSRVKIRNADAEDLDGVIAANRGEGIAGIKSGAQTYRQIQY